MKLKAHPIAECYPPMSSAEYAALRDDVKKYGVLTPIWLFEGMILDGIHRFRAADETGRTCPTQDYTGDDPIGFVQSLNHHRRHLSPNQRAMIAAKLANISHGGDRRSAIKPPNGGLKLEDAAKAENVPLRAAERARTVLSKAKPAVIKAVEEGAMTLATAEKTIKPKPAPSTNGHAKVEPVTQADKLTAAKEEAGRMRQLASEISRIKKELLSICDEPIGTFMRAQLVETHAGNLVNTINAALPHAQCGYCDGREKRCKACHGLGWVSRDVHRFTAKELQRA